MTPDTIRARAFGITFDDSSSGEVRSDSKGASETATAPYFSEVDLRQRCIDLEAALRREQARTQYYDERYNEAAQAAYDWRKRAEAGALGQRVDEWPRFGVFVLLSGICGVAWYFVVVTAGTAWEAVRR